MRVLHVLHYFPPHLGGVENFVFNFIKETLRRDGRVEHHIVTSWDGGTRVFSSKRVRIYRLRPVAYVHRSPVIISLPLFLQKLASRRRYDVLHLHQEFQVPVLAASLFKGLFSFARGNVVSNYGLPFSGSILSDLTMRGIWYSFIKQFVYGGADKIVVNLRVYVRLLRECFGVEPEKLLYIPNSAVNFRELEVDQEFCREILEKYNIEPEKTVIFVGRHVRRKGLPDLLRAFKYLKYDLGRSDICLAVLSEGELTSRMRSWATEHGLNNVKFVGRVPRKVLTCFYRGAAALVLPSYGEGLPISVLEAFACGQPVIATPLPWVREGFEAAVVLVRKGCPTDIACKVVEVIDNLQYYRERAERVKNYVARNYSYEKVSLEYLKLYRSVLGNDV